MRELAVDSDVLARGSSGLIRSRLNQVLLRWVWYWVAVLADPVGGAPAELVVSLRQRNVINYASLEIIVELGVHEEVTLDVSPQVLIVKVILVLEFQVALVTRIVHIGYSDLQRKSFLNLMLLHIDLVPRIVAFDVKLADLLAEVLARIPTASTTLLSPV